MVGLYDLIDNRLSPFERFNTNKLLVLYPFTYILNTNDEDGMYCIHFNIHFCISLGE